LLDNSSRAQAKVLLLDDFFAREGLLDEKGEPRGATKFYLGALNSARHALVRLNAHLIERPAPSALEASLEAEAVEDGDGD